MRNLEKQPTVSVIIPLYNHGKYIDAALDSVVSQTMPPVEIIVVDDGSSDDSFQRVWRRAENDERIITWSHLNQGAHATINAAIQRATGDYVSILNSDDCYLPERFEICLKSLAADPEAAAVCTALTFFDGAGTARSNKWYQDALAFYEQIGDLSLALINGNFLMTTSNLFIRRRVFAEIGMFANLRYAHDLDFFLRLIGHNKKILWLQQPLLKYRMHDSNTISEDALKVKFEWAAVVACYVFRHAKRHDWIYIKRLEQITDRHRLTRLLFFCFLQFQKGGVGQVLPENSPENFLADPEFMEFMAGVIQ